MLIAGMAVLTFIPRYLPMAFAGKAVLPPLIERAFGFVPIAVLSAIIAQTVLIRDGSLTMSFANPHLLAALVACGVAIWKKHLFLTIAVGLLVYGLARFILI
jgi:branched-subunit amino acid transport protein